MADELEGNHEEGDPGPSMAMGTGLGLAFGAAFGTIVFVFAENPIWIALGAGLGASLGAVIGILGSR